MKTITEQVILRAIEHRRTLSFPFIAVTGSNGKTTTKRMISTILQQAGRVYDFDYYSDVANKIAAELLQIKDCYDWALVKLGAVEPESVRMSAELIKPFVGIITNVGEAHLSHHGSIEKIAQEKRYLLHNISPEGAAVINRDNEYTRDMAKDFAGRVLFFGLSELCDFCATNIDHLGPEGTAFTICRKEGNSLRLHMPIYSLGDVYNALAAVAVADFFHIDDEKIVIALEKHFRLPDGRGALHNCVQNIRIIDDTYDATPQSLMKSTKALLEFKEYSNRLILIMGDMSELGEQSPTMHAMMGHYLAALPIDMILLVGSDVKATEEAIKKHPLDKMKLRSFSDLASAKTWLLSELAANDTVLIEGSDEEDFSQLVKHLLQSLSPNTATKTGMNN